MADFDLKDGLQRLYAYKNPSKPYQLRFDPDPPFIFIYAHHLSSMPLPYRADRPRVRDTLWHHIQTATDNADIGPQKYFPALEAVTIACEYDLRWQAFLLATGTTVLIFSDEDQYFGRRYQPEIQEFKGWNVLGEIFMHVRSNKLADTKTKMASILVPLSAPPASSLPKPFSGAGGSGGVGSSTGGTSARSASQSAFRPTRGLSHLHSNSSGSRLPPSLADLPLKDFGNLKPIPPEGSVPVRPGTSLGHAAAPFTRIRRNSTAPPGHLPRQPSASESRAAFPRGAFPPLPGSDLDLSGFSPHLSDNAAGGFRPRTASGFSRLPTYTESTSRAGHSSGLGGAGRSGTPTSSSNPRMRPFHTDTAHAPPLIPFESLRPLPGRPRGSGLQPSDWAHLTEAELDARMADMKREKEELLRRAYPNFRRR